MRDSVPRWSLPPLPFDAGAGERLHRRRAEAYLTNRIRWIWNEFCSGNHLIRRVVPTGYGSWEVPRLGPIALGPPTRFSVELRPGQLREDFVAARARLASAYGVDDVEVRDLVRGWITVELVEDGSPPGSATALRRGPGPRRLPIAPPPRHVPPRHVPPRHRRGPFGGPRSSR